MLRLAAVLLLVTACAPRSAAPTPPPGGEFSRFVDEYFEAGNRYSPTSAVAYGFHDYDDQLEDLGRARVEARIAELHGLLDRLAKSDAATLSFDDAIDATAIGNDARAQLLDLETLRTWERNPMSYASLPGQALDVLMKRDFAPKQARLRSVVRRLRGIPAIYAAARANVKNPARPFTELAVIMAKGSTSFLEESVPVWARVAALLAELTQANQAAVAESKAFVTWLETDLLPRSTGDYALGKDLFLEKLRLEEMVELPLDELLAKGEAQLQKDRAAYLATAKLIDPTRDALAVALELSKDHPSPDDLIPAVARSVEAARKFLVDKDLITIPSEVRPKVAETPPYDRGSSFASMDTPGPYETKATEAFYYVSPVEKDWDAAHVDDYLRAYAYPIMAMVNVHEAFPGHYVQFLYGPRVPTKTRKLLGAGSNAEGWAHYTEEMMVDQGFGGGDPRIRLAQLEEALLRDCRYVVGIKEHTAGMTVEQGARLFVEQCAQTPANGLMEARRGTFNPTYLYYTLGKLMIKDLRDEYMSKKGASLKQFHDAFVSQGALPIPLTRKLLFR
jgi:uncharacterized protein (DUF885 family)